MKEVYKPIAGYENELEISNLGNVRKIVNKSLYLSKNQNRKMINYKKNCFSAHVQVFKAFNKNYDKNKVIMFKDGNVNNLNIDNLYQVSYSAISNVACENNFRAKLTKEKIYDILLDYINGLSVADLSKKYNIHNQNIYRILYNKIWVNVPRPYVSSKDKNNKKLIKKIENLKSKLTK